MQKDNLIVKGLKSLDSFTFKLYSSEKSKAKANAQLTFIGEKKIEDVQSQLYTYDRIDFELSSDIDGFFQISKLSPKNHWLNYHGIHDVAILEKLGSELALDRLSIKQILDTTQRPKVDDFEKYLFFSVKSITKSEVGQMQVEQLSFVLGNNYVLSFQERKGDHFEGIRNKIKENIGFIRKRKCDYLLTQLLDAILDNYFETLDLVNDEINQLEKETFQNPTSHTLLQIEGYKRSALLIKKSLGPFKEALLKIQNDRTTLIDKGNLKYFKDLSNSAIAALEEVEGTLRTLEGLTNIYFASLSQKMNETMKVLTTVATIFIPLTFIAGIYGMNFNYMPELNYRYGYFITWGVMVAITIAMLIYFKIKKWM
ncbi:MAG: magnesium/cobalt transporter CorA [bacterium]|nr:magnesium/cobalt transporter CorA [bacterium]